MIFYYVMKRMINFYEAQYLKELSLTYYINNLKLDSTYVYCSAKVN